MIGSLTNFGIHKIRNILYSKMLERTNSSFAAEGAHYRKGDQGENRLQQLPRGQSGSLRSQDSQAIRGPVLGKESEFCIIKKRKTVKRK